MRIQKVSKTLLLIPLMLTASTRLPAAETSFNPSLALGQFYTTNVTFVSEEQSSDTFTSLSLLLPVTVQTRRSTVSLSYNPSYQAYNEFTNFDNLSHAVNAMLDTSWSRTNSLDVSANFYRGQDQGRAESDLEGDFFLTRRSTRNEGTFAVNYSDRFSKSWLWGIGASAASLSYEEISPIDVMPPQDRDGVGADAWFGREISPTTSIGFRAQVSQFRYDLSGDQIVQLYSLGLSRRLSRQSNLDLSLGGFVSELDPEFLLPGEPNETSTGFQGSLSYASSFDSFDILLAASHQPTLGASRGGASTNSYASFTLSKALAKRVAGSLALRYARTEPFAEVFDGTESVSLGGNLSWQALKVLSLALNVGYIHQSPLTTGSIPTSSESNVMTAGLSVVWNPLANRPIAQGAS